jgi:hypothetical protein
MKAITVWQPWATLIARGVKPYEFRGWPAPNSLVGQRIAIHAGSRPVKRVEIADLILRLRGPEAWTTGLHADALDILERADVRSYWRSAVVATATLGRPVLASTLTCGLDGAVNDSDRNTHSNWAWPMIDVRPLSPPVDAAGAQGFWNWRAP